MGEEEEAACPKELLLILACFFEEKWMVCSSLREGGGSRQRGKREILCTCRQGFGAGELVVSPRPFPVDLSTFLYRKGCNLRGPSGILP